ncbi:hypothetical protein VCHE16_3094, partial [Vibrio paracholerae HE-16]
MLQQLEQRL